MHYNVSDERKLTSAMRNESALQRFDFVLFGAVIILIVFGIMMIASATQGAIDPELINRVPDQINYAVIGVVVMLALSFFDYRNLSGLSIWLYIINIILLMLVFLFGVEGDGGAQRWLNLGIRIQPSEIGKIVLIITLSSFLATRYQEMDKLTTVMKALLYVAIPTALVFIQPNLGMTIIYGVVTATILWGAGLRLRHIAIFMLIGIISLPIVVSQLRGYQLSRITTFLNPDSDPDARYNVDQAVISVGSGGITGKGYTIGSQNQGRFLRVRHTDFIFSVIAHEFGFVGAVSTIGLIGLVLARILRGARYASDPLGAMICYGVGAMIFFQTVVSIGMNLRLMPVTGLTLPFVSSGGTSLMFTLIGIGLVQSVIIRRRRLAI
jgi:rod shape determining protein RodA